MGHACARFCSEIRVGNLFSIHESEDDQDEEEHQFPMQPPLPFDAKEPLC